MSLNSFQYGKEFRILSQTNDRLISNLSLKIKLHKNLWGRTSYTKDIVMKMEREKKKQKGKFILYGTTISQSIMYINFVSSIKHVFF